MCSSEIISGPLQYFFAERKFYVFLQSQKGTIAQLVEQRTENPCVRGSIPRGTTETE